MSSSNPEGCRFASTATNGLSARPPKQKIGFAPLDNGFSSCDDVPGLQEICDSLGPAHIDALLRKWLRILPNPFTDADETAGYRYELSILQAEFSVTQMLDRPVSGRIFFEQVLPRQPRHRPPRSDRPGLRPARHPQGQTSDPGPVPHPGHHRRRRSVPARGPQEHQDQTVSPGREGPADRDHHQRHPRLRVAQTADQPARPAADRLHRQPAPARRRTISHDPVRGATAFTDLTTPIITDTGTRIPGLRFGDARVHALLIHRLLPHGFTNRDLRTLIAPLLGTTTEDITAGKITYDLRRLRTHGLIHRIPHTRRYQITDAGLHHALFLTHAHDHLLRTGLAELTDPDPPMPSRLRTAARTYQAAFDDLAHYAHLAA